MKKLSKHDMCERNVVKQEFHIFVQHLCNSAFFQQFLKALICIHHQKRRNPEELQKQQLLKPAFEMFFSAFRMEGILHDKFLISNILKVNFQLFSIN